MLKKLLKNIEHFVSMSQKFKNKVFEVLDCKISIFSSIQRYLRQNVKNLNEMKISS